MNARPEAKSSRVAGFRTKVLVAMMLIVSAVTGFALYFAERDLAANAEAELQRAFERELTSLHNAQEIRHAVFDERCRALARRPRFHAAVEDRPTPDLLYPSAEADLSDIMRRDDDAPDQPAHALRAEFYRFLDGKGAVIPPPNARVVGVLERGEEAQLALPRVPDRQQVGYIWRQGGGGKTPAIFEIIASPLISSPFFASDTSETVAALVLGLKPYALGGARAAGIKSGIWLKGRLDVDGLAEPAASVLAGEIGRTIAAGGAESHLRVEVAGTPHQLFYKRLNPDSLFPPAYEVCFYPLTELGLRQRQLRWQVLGLGGLLLLGGLVASNYVAGQLSAPVEKLAVDSEEQRAQRERAEAALELTHEELQRSARFSADASHQLKTPVTVMRAGLEELLTRDNLTPDECDQLSGLIHQTYRLSSLIEDLLLLSRMDAGRLKLEIAPVNLSALVEAALDDLGALPDELELRVETNFPPELHIAGEKRYTTIILQNLLENARKYNRRGGSIQISVTVQGAEAVLAVGNTGRPIRPESRAHIFERFHRGGMGENVPGYGLGLNLARELARLHGGDLRLVRSDENWTEFEVRFQLAAAPVAARPLA